MLHCFVLILSPIHMGEPVRQQVCRPHSIYGGKLLPEARLRPGLDTEDSCSTRQIAQRSLKTQKM
jgi:hypothetical protein